jgi:molecular chaperone GrpE
MLQRFWRKNSKGKKMEDQNNKAENNQVPSSETPAADCCGPEEQDFVSMAPTATDARETEIETMKKQIEDLRGENEGLKDSRLRVLAEFDNYKRRTARDSIRMVECANENLVKELIPVLENFERALDPAHKEKDIDAFYKGVELIYNLFYDKLQKAGLAEYNPIGEEFNSEKHEALMHVASAEVPEHRITQVLQKGYSLNNKMIQYAKVAVSKGNSEA